MSYLSHNEKYYHFILKQSAKRNRPNEPEPAEPEAGFYVGTYTPYGDFVLHSIFDTQDEADIMVHFLNGGSSEKHPFPSEQEV